MADWKARKARDRRTNGTHGTDGTNAISNLRAHRYALAHPAPPGSWILAPGFLP
jgi:hypothetical protein